MDATTSLTNTAGQGFADWFRFQSCTWLRVVSMADEEGRCAPGLRPAPYRAQAGRSGQDPSPLPVFGEGANRPYGRAIRP